MNRAQINFAKMAADLDTNPKIRRAGRNAREVYLFVLRRNANAKGQGSIPISNVDTWYMAEQLQMTEAEAKEGLARAQTPYIDVAGKEHAPLLIISDGMVMITGWDDDWGRYPMDEAERKRQQRARDREEQREADGLQIPLFEQHVSPNAIDVRTVTNCPDSHGSDQIRDRSEIDQRESRARGRARSHTHKGDRVPRGWAPEPTDDNVHAQLEAASKGVVVEMELQKFREKPQPSEAFTDLNARWRYWLLNAKPTPNAVRDAIARIEREKVAQATRDRERAESAAAIGRPVFSALPAEEREEVDRMRERIATNPEAAAAALREAG